VTTARRRVLLTGATGVVASQLRPALAQAYDLALVDVRSTSGTGEPVEGVKLVDLLGCTDAELHALLDGVDTVVHCGYLQPAGEPSYAEERLNLDMTARVYEAARTAGVRRVVVASTNQASKGYEQPWAEQRIDRVGPEDYPRPDSFYGWAKAAYESLGFLYACGALGRRLEVVAVRIVAPREIRAADFADRPLERYLRDIAGYVSPRDLAQLFTRSVDAASVEDRFGVPFQIFYGVSANARTFWSITNARKVVGYAPQDDSEVRFADEIAAMLARG
jgi:nucleoside-diphosphate-sugar epimerase